MIPRRKITNKELRSTNWTMRNKLLNCDILSCISYLRIWIYRSRRYPFLFQTLHPLDNMTIDLSCLFCNIMTMRIIWNGISVLTNNKSVCYVASKYLYFFIFLFLKEHSIIYSILGIMQSAAYISIIRTQCKYLFPSHLTW